MKPGKYTFRDLFNNRYIEKMVVPEIQRDYVWRTEQVKSLFSSTLEDFRKYQNFNGTEISGGKDQELTDALRDFARKRQSATNIGFIYAYTDADSAGDYFLIDGQQRITTLLLTLLALAALNEQCRDRFQANYCENEILKFRYRVREGSEAFLRNLTKDILAGQSDFQNQSWYHDRYATDLTIQNLGANFIKLKDLCQQSVDAKILPEYFTFLEDFVEFWYFDTNISPQGEQLYIYMNARGEHMQENENLKAFFLENVRGADEKQKWGRQWEAWQDFFWKRRNQNPTADRGFNELITCIAALRNYRNNIQSFYTKDEFDGNSRGAFSEISFSDLKQALGPEIQTIAERVQQLEFLETSIDSWRRQYNYSAWLDRMFEECWEILSGDKEDSPRTNWFADYDDKNRGAEQNRMVFLWSMLCLLESKPDSDLLFRAMRVIYVRFKNYNRSVGKVKKNIDAMLKSGVWGATAEFDDVEDEDSIPNTLVNEERLKHDFLLSLPAADVRQYEQVIWQIEDHPLNLNGRGLGAVNSSHLIDYAQKPSLDYLKKVSEKFYSIFPVDNLGKLVGNSAAENVLTNTLLYYDHFWRRKAPWYYENYSFGEWPRVIRDKDGPAFRQFFCDLVASDLQLADICEQKRAKYLADETIDFNTTTREIMFLWYATNLGERLWQNGSFLALDNRDGADRHFPNLPPLKNTPGNIRAHKDYIVADRIEETKG
jgi:hypothetical protein